MRFLHLLSTHDWDAYPLVVDPKAVLSKAQLSGVLAGFQKRQTMRSKPPCCIITHYDEEGTIWTKQKPCLEMLTRARILAQRALDTISGQLWQATFVSRYVLIVISFVENRKFRASTTYMLLNFCCFSL
jgi:U3 small nucleolar RNA-associated protein 22